MKVKANQQKKENKAWILTTDTKVELPTSERVASQQDGINKALMKIVEGIKADGNIPDVDEDTNIIILRRPDCDSVAVGFSKIDDCMDGKKQILSEDDLCFYITSIPA